MNEKRDDNRSSAGESTSRNSQTYPRRLGERRDIRATRNVSTLFTVRFAPRPRRDINLHGTNYELHMFPFRHYTWTYPFSKSVRENDVIIALLQTHHLYANRENPCSV